MTQVVLRRELRTPLGIFAPGCVFPGERSGDGWQLELLPAIEGGRSHPATVEAKDVTVLRRRRRLTNASGAQAEYEFAHRKLGLSHFAAMGWLMERFGVTAGQLHRWGVVGRAS
ncbi:MULTISPECIES: hypothetical protein [Nocardia]|uniref:hypothetical protein n=1 Tax=Nocardia TaxID=1817 RepID=UPI002458157A|nr:MULTISPECIES: hypothetical protein [Nocardia]